MQVSIFHAHLHRPARVAKVGARQCGEILLRHRYGREVRDVCAMVEAEHAAHLPALRRRLPNLDVARDAIVLQRTTSGPREEALFAGQNRKSAGERVIALASCNWLSSQL